MEIKRSSIKVVAASCETEERDTNRIGDRKIV